MNECAVCVSPWCVRLACGPLVGLCAAWGSLALGCSELPAPPLKRDRQRAEAAIRELLQAAYARTDTTAKGDLSKQLLALAAAEKKDLAQRYVALRQARELGEAAGEFDIARRAQEQLDLEFAPPAPRGGSVVDVSSWHLEMTFDARNGTVTLYVSNAQAKLDYPIEALTIPALVSLEGREEPLDLDLKPVPLAGEPTGKCSRFSGTAAELAQAKVFKLALVVPIEKNSYRARLVWEADKARTGFVCPMDCEAGKLYEEQAKCPICGMALTGPEEAHSDHNPKHGGQFFMAPNRWHHLEGVLVGQEFRLYLYNNFTKPISAQSFENDARVRIVGLDEKGKEVGKPVEKKLKASAQAAEWLEVAVPKDTAVPFQITAFLLFDGQAKPERFDFIFNKP